MKRLFSNENVPRGCLRHLLFNQAMNLFSARNSPTACESGAPWALNGWDSALFFALLQCGFTGCHDKRAARKGMWQHWGSVFGVRTSLLLHCCGVGLGMVF